jgi:hypothetical protein
MVDGFANRWLYQLGAQKVEEFKATQGLPLKAAGDAGRQFSNRLRL